MRVLEIKDKFGIDHLTLTERPDPTPGKGEVVIKLRAASLNYRDLMTVKGDYNPKMRLPRIPFSDGAGDVVSVGEGVSRVKVGDRVTPIFMQTWIDGEVTQEKGQSALGGSIDGVLAEYAAFDQAGMVHIPDHLTYEEAATLPCAGVTAWSALVTEGRLTAGDIVLLQGTGGVSIFSLQFAKLVGARIIIISSSDEKLERARQLGAHELINYRTTLDWDKQAQELTGKRGVDHVVEVGGAGTLDRSFNAARAAGQISVIGALSGRAGEIRTATILMKRLRVQGIYVGSRAMFEAMNRAITLHQLRPVIDRVFPFTETPAALKYMESGAHFGKVCLTF